MKASKFTDAQKAFILKQGSDGHPVAEICRKAGIREATYFNWKKKYDGLLPDEMRRMGHGSDGGEVDAVGETGIDDQDHAELSDDVVSGTGSELSLLFAAQTQLLRDPLDAIHFVAVSRRAATDLLQVYNRPENVNDLALRRSGAAD